eukprot:scaffold29728_cov63-Phaeocystis_antarctica.AAC.2
MKADTHVWTAHTVHTAPVSERDTKDRREAPAPSLARRTDEGGCRSPVLAHVVPVRGDNQVNWASRTCEGDNQVTLGCSAGVCRTCMAGEVVRQ